ncbi:leukotriene A-4 hydrolase-like [Mya arenaria]|uniref:leukotriene A-4 hydrolase-like n=1 Tax=Mya arenaria TaxID=6604 RepID=UPI0022E12ABF|nr:leukotriene A-4 hydrolase-like [Mya arenaria]XP_052779284.1 leukotriene A-4 hydrolase-like [Mya arenaria]XP_052779286.1 leukotriene A-4 hydrolase-like [Mya arenaria]
MPALSQTDPSSFSNPEDVLVEHIHLDLTVCFTKHTLSGSVQLKLKRVKPEAEFVVLDTRGITVTSVVDLESAEKLQYTLAEKVAVFGSKLTIRLTNRKTEHTIEITYETSPECSALQWLRPEQTAGKRQPYLFSQCEAIHCRSMIPCQDTPSVKAPYTAKIKAPSVVKVLMSALLEGSEKTEDGQMVHSFRQNQPMPSYLIAIVAGDIVSKEIGPRSKVWTEPELIEAAAYEFAETESMLQAGEGLLGPYVWGHYDLLVLPPSFPYGGMENPCLTFVTPTLLAGDRSLADVVAHEIAHSWTGNLVTNASWSDFWLNEGFTVFVERKIVSRLKDSEVYRQFLASRGWRILTETIKQLGAENKFTCLVPDMLGVDPDESFSSVPYEKGQAFLFYLEQLLGGPEVFEKYLRAYIDKFKGKSVTTADWKAFLLEYFNTEEDAGKLATVDWQGWMYEPGMPPQKPVYDTSLAENCEELRNRWLGLSDDQLTQFTLSDIEDFQPMQIEQFLSGFADHDPISCAKVKHMGEVYKLNTVTNAEIKFRWLQLCIQAQHEPIIDEALQFVSDQGRMKFVQPVYRDLYKWSASRQRAKDNFLAHRNEMHNITVAKLEKILDVKK